MQSEGRTRGVLKHKWLNWIILVFSCTQYDLFTLEEKEKTSLHYRGIFDGTLLKSLWILDQCKHSFVHTRRCYWKYVRNYWQTVNTMNTAGQKRIIGVCEMYFLSKVMFQMIAWCGFKIAISFVIFKLLWPEFSVEIAEWQLAPSWTERLRPHKVLARPQRCIPAHWDTNDFLLII